MKETVKLEHRNLASRPWRWLASSPRLHPESGDSFCDRRGGCRHRLLSQYRTIGSALLRIEGQAKTTLGVYDVYSSGWVKKEFRESVVCISTEVLKAYFDDLVDDQVSEESLCLVERRFWPRFDPLVLVSFLSSVGVVVHIAQLDGSFVSVLLSIVLLFPLIAVWLRSPFSGRARRFVFAGLVSREISRRMGGGEQDIGEAGLRISELFSGEVSRFGTSSAARTIYWSFRVGGKSN